MAQQIWNIQYNSECYKNNTEIETADLGGYPWKDNSMSYSFYQCSNLTNVTNINENVTNMSGTFANCYNLVDAPVLPNNVENMHVTFGGCNKLSTMPNLPNSVVDMAGSFQLCSNIIDSTIIPNSVVDMSDTFYGCSNLVNIPVIPNNVELMTGTFHGCTNITDEVIINSAIVENANKCFYLTNAIKNVFIPFWNQEDEHSVSFNSFNVVAGYPTEEPRVNGVLLYDINDWYLFDWRFRTEQNGVRRLYEYLGNKTNIVVPKYKTFLNDVTYESDFYNCPFYNKQQFESIDLNFVPIANNSMGYWQNGMFFNCQNLRTVTNINENVTSMCGTFCNCFNLTDAPIIPDKVEKMFFTFQACFNLTDAPIIPNSVTNMYGTFQACFNLINVSNISNSVVDMSSTFEACYNLETAPSIPNSVVTMDYTFCDCSKLKTAPSIPNSVVDMTATFMGCSKLNGISEFPNSVVNIPLVFKWCSNLRESPVIPNTVRNMCAAYDSCFNLTVAPVIPEGVINVGGAFYQCINIMTAPNIPSTINGGLTDWLGKGLFESCFKLAGDIYILSNNITNATNCFYGTSLEKDVYIHFKNNGVYTSTYNAFVNAGYSETERVHGALLKDIDDEGIDLSDYEYTNVSNDITLYNYIGNKRIITTPHLS